MPDQVRHDALVPFKVVTTRLKTNDPVFTGRVVRFLINQRVVVAEILVFEELFSERSGKADKTGAKQQHVGRFRNRDGAGIAGCATIIAKHEQIRIIQKEVTTP